MDVEATLLEHSKEINQLQTDVAALTITRQFFKEMIERNTESNEKLSSTLLEVEKSMVTMNEKMDNQTRTIASMKIEMENNTKQLNERISNVKSQIEAVDEEGKFNIRTFIRNYLPWIIVIIGAGILTAGTFVKF